MTRGRNAIHGTLFHAVGVRTNILADDGVVVKLDEAPKPVTMQLSGSAQLIMTTCPTGESTSDGNAAVGLLPAVPSSGTSNRMLEVVIVDDAVVDTRRCSALQSPH
jgi:hypothetical protein